MPLQSALVPVWLMGPRNRCGPNLTARLKEEQLTFADRHIGSVPLVLAESVDYDRPDFNGHLAIEWTHGAAVREPRGARSPGASLEARISAEGDREFAPGR